jgi:hypothetical protein
VISDLEGKVLSMIAIISRGVYVFCWAILDCDAVGSGGFVWLHVYQIHILMATLVS